MKLILILAFVLVVSSVDLLNKYSCVYTCQGSLSSTDSEKLICTNTLYSTVINEDSKIYPEIVNGTEEKPIEKEKIEQLALEIC